MAELAVDAVDYVCAHSLGHAFCIGSAPISRCAPQQEILVVAPALVQPSKGGLHSLQLVLTPEGIVLSSFSSSSSSYILIAIIAIIAIILALQIKPGTVYALHSNRFCRIHPVSRDRCNSMEQINIQSENCKGTAKKYCFMALSFILSIQSRLFSSISYKCMFKYCQ